MCKREYKRIYKISICKRVFGKFGRCFKSILLLS